MENKPPCPPNDEFITSFEIDYILDVIFPKKDRHQSSLKLRELLDLPADPYALTDKPKITPVLAREAISKLLRLGRVLNLLENRLRSEEFTFYLNIERRRLQYQPIKNCLSSDIGLWLAMQCIESEFNNKSSKEDLNLFFILNPAFMTLLEFETLRFRMTQTPTAYVKAADLDALFKAPPGTTQDLIGKLVPETYLLHKPHIVKLNNISRILNAFSAQMPDCNWPSLLGAPQKDLGGSMADIIGTSPGLRKVMDLISANVPAFD